MSKSRTSFRWLIPLLIFFLLLSSCASISSFFKGSGKKYKEAVQEWEEGEYGDSMYSMISLLQSDPNYKKAKVFVKENFQTAIEKTHGRIEAAKKIEDQMEKTHSIYKRYQDLYLVVEKAKEIVPLEGPKEEWVWDPEFPKDYLAEYEGARKAAVQVRLAKAEELFNAEKLAEARELIYKCMSAYLQENEWDTEAEIALRKETANKISELAKTAVENIVTSTDKEQLKEGLETLDMALKYNSEDKEVASIREKIENQMIDVLFTEAKEIEAGGDLDSFKEARKKYRSALNEFPESKKLSQALSNVNMRIADAYYEKGYALEQKGDEASLKEAIDLYDEGLEYDESSKKLVSGKNRARASIADQYYQKALAEEKSVGQDIEKGKEVIALYETAQEWVEGYKDTEARIEAIKESISVTIYVAAQSGDLFRKLEEELDGGVHRKLGSDFSVRSSADSKEISPANVDQGNYLQPAKQIGADYIVVLTGELGPVNKDIEENRRSESIDYQITDDGTIEELPAGGLSTLKFGEGSYDTKNDYLDSIGLQEYGTAEVTVIENTRTINRVVYLDYKVVNVKSGSTVYTGERRQTFNASKETILADVTGDHSRITDWYKNNLNTDTSYSKSEPSEAKWMSWIKEEADFVNSKAGAISKAIKSDRG